jgi:L-ascorbate metabolism protein UlaG (beta-lactamase superfamily)
LTLLTDPLFRSRLGPLRRHGPVPDPAALPHLDVVLVSHAHPDHFDPASLRRVPGHPLVIVPRGIGPRIGAVVRPDRLREVNLGDVVEHGPWRIHAVRARHWRWPFAPQARALGYLIEGPIGVYFAGDTDEFTGMRELAGRVDLALLPIGRWGPQPTPGHLTPESAARVAATIEARAVVPIHWGTFYPAGLERVYARALLEPPQALLEHAARLAPRADIRPLTPGATAAVEV